MEVVGGHRSKDKKSGKDDKRPLSNLVLFCSADSDLLHQSFQANMTKELVYFFLQAPYLLKIDDRDFVFPKICFYLLSFFFKLDNRYLELLKSVRKVNDVTVFGGVGCAAWPGVVLVVKVTVGDTAVCFDEGGGLVQAPDQRRSRMKVVAVARKTDGDSEEGRLGDEACNARLQEDLLLLLPKALDRIFD